MVFRRFRFAFGSALLSIAGVWVFALSFLSFLGVAAAAAEAFGCDSFDLLFEFEFLADALPSLAFGLAFAADVVAGLVAAAGVSDFFGSRVGEAFLAAAAF